MFLSMITWCHFFYSVVRQNIIAEMCGRRELLTEGGYVGREGERETETETQRERASERE
jgi:hypothetical protein